ncbi:hypothetical protein HHI36_009421 [Cryptolaemus montrouzieri]|uniref:Uncharacterized protein n=1 Tax=Cryptolaemus montrouzieri TaxID=559131 RepID=A0ABD2MVF0_9CUCU
MLVKGASQSYSLNVPLNSVRDTHQENASRFAPRNRSREARHTYLFSNSEFDIHRKEDPITYVLKEALEPIIKYSRELDTRVYENSNTKVEIKIAVALLKRNVDVLERESTKEWLEAHKYLKIEIPKYDTDTQTELNDYDKKERST